MRNILISSAVLMASLIGPLPAAVGHPGRTDERGCHKVSRTWTSKDGQRTYLAGTTHCHRVGEVILGKDEIRVEEDEQGTEQENARSRPARTKRR